MSITRLPEDQPGFFMLGITPVPPGAVREVAVHGVPAALIERQFHHLQPSGEIAISDDAQLTSEAEGLRYTLSAFRWAAAGDWLLRIAESMPPAG